MIAVQEYVAQLENITIELIERIHQVSYTELSQYADQREVISLKIISNQQSLTEADKKRIQQLTRFDKVILCKMESYKTEASEWFAKKGLSKVNRQHTMLNIHLIVYFLTKGINNGKRIGLVKR